MTQDQGQGDPEQISGRIFHIIRGSFVDGYGIRTTIFLKGCPLRCIWCCNPEGQKIHPEIKFTSSRCDGCGRCIEVCPQDAIFYSPVQGSPKIQLNRNKCHNCGQCVEVCFTGALEYFDKRMSVGEVFNIVRKDEKYFRNSGGGLTIGGGEPTLQAHFTYALMKLCQKNHFHVAIDTCGHTQSDLGLNCLKEADLVLFDIKGIDPEEHLRNTDVSNEIILQNLKILADLGKSIIIRLPLVPNYNDSDANITGIAELLTTLKSVERVDLLPYHEYGKVKYEQLGKSYQLGELGIQTQTDDQLAAIIDRFAKYGLKTQIGG